MALQSLKDRFDYGLNPEKLGAVSSYLCDPATAHAEFMLVKNQYQGETDRRAGHGALCYQIRQAFPHGEVTAEEANRIGYETAMRWTKGKYSFFLFPCGSCLWQIHSRRDYRNRRNSHRRQAHRTSPHPLSGHG